MSDTPFHQTRMGHVFFEGTIPALVCELARLNNHLERLCAVLDKPEEPEPTRSPIQQEKER